MDLLWSQVINNRRWRWRLRISVYKSQIVRRDYIPYFCDLVFILVCQREMYCPFVSLDISALSPRVLRSRKTNFNSSFFYELICIFPSPVFCETFFCVYCVLFLEYNFALLVCNDVCVNMKGSRGMKGCLACTNNHIYTTLLLEYSSYQHHNYDCSNYYI